MNRILAKYLFLTIERLRGERVDLHLSEMERNQYLPATELRALQTEKLAALLHHVQRTRNPFYLRKYSGFDPHTDFGKLPLLAKSEIREQYKSLVTPGFERRVALCKTSGSTGEPLKFYRDREVFGRTLASVLRAHRWYNIDIGAKEAMLWGIPSGFGNRVRMHARDFVLNRFREYEYNLDPAVLNRFFSDLRAKRPEYVFGYTSMVYEFAMFVRERKLSLRDVHLKGAVCTAESIPEYQRELIQSVLECPVISEYGSAETGIISYQCPMGGHHVSSDAVLVEIIDDNGTPVEIGEVGRVVVSVLHSQAAPIIRYDLGDYAAFSTRSCPCGRTLPLFDQIVGRTSSVIVTPSGRCFHSIVLYYIMKDYADKYGGVRQFRVRQTQIDRLEFHIVASAEFGPQEQHWIEQTVRERFGETVQVEFFIHDALERSASGKLKDFETELDTNDYLLASFRQANPLIFASRPSIDTKV